MTDAPRLTRWLRPLGLAPAHYSLMLSVRADPGLTGAELAPRLGVTPQAVASLVGKLEKRGHLRRRAHPRHRHIQELYLTGSGVEELAAADAVIALTGDQDEWSGHGDRALRCDCQHRPAGG